MLIKWSLKGSKKLFECNIFNVLLKQYEKPENKGDFEANILDLPNWVNVIAFNQNDEILLIRQFRFGVDEIELEIPGGIIEPGEEPKDAGIRELKEETGYEIVSIEQIGKVSSNPSFMNNFCYTYLVKLGEKGSVSFDPGEIIESEFATLSDVKKLLAEGKITNAYCVLAFLWLALYDDGKIWNQS